MVWFISDGGEIARDLRGFLLGQSDPQTPLRAIEAEGQPSRLVIDLGLDPRFSPETVVPGVKEALTNPDSGILALQNIPIGGSLFRSQFFHVVLAVEGVLSIRAMSVDGHPAPFAATVGRGHFRDFLSGLEISGTPVEHASGTHAR
jgi:hypothetical protein